LDREGMEEIGSQIKVSRYPVEARIGRGSAGDPRHVMQEQEANQHQTKTNQLSIDHQIMDKSHIHCL